MNAGVDERFEAVLSPLSIRNAELRNRIVRAGHATKYVKDGQVTDQLIAYHLERARGMVGMSIVEVASVHPSSWDSGYLVAYDDRVIDGWSRLADQVHAEGMAVFQQLWHGGNRWSSDAGQPPWSASTVPSVVLGTPPVPMTKGMIDDVTAGFAGAAARAKRAGIDGVEIHAAHGYLLEQFLSPITNLREDEYGGPLENRARFLIEVLTAIRSEVGDYPVGVRMNARQWVDGGLEPTEMAEAAKLLEATGLIDFIDVSVGVHETHHRMIGPAQDPHGYQLPDTTQVTRAVSVPTIVTGRFHTLAEANAVIQSGDADMVSMVRALIADPHLVRKTLDGLDPRPCIGVNGCLASGKMFRHMACDVNPLAGYESELDEVIERADSAGKVLVIGGGPAGLEAARVAALRGHEVVLMEAADRVGGQALLCHEVPGRGDYEKIADWLRGQAEDLGVDIRTGVRATVERVEEFGDLTGVIVATGPQRREAILQIAKPDVLIPMDASEIITGSWEFLHDRASIPSTAVVLDDVGHHEGYSVVEMLASLGCAVTLVTRHLSLAAAVEPSLLPARMRERLAELPVTLRPRGFVAGVDGNKVTIGSLDGPETQVIEAEVFIPIMYHEPNRGLEQALQDRYRVEVVGEALTQRFLSAAISSGHRAARGF